MLHTLLSVRGSFYLCFHLLFLLLFNNLFLEFRNILKSTWCLMCLFKSFQGFFVFFKHFLIDFSCDFDHFVRFLHLLDVFVVIFDDLTSERQACFLCIVAEQLHLGHICLLAEQNPIDPVDSTIFFSHEVNKINTNTNLFIPSRIIYLFRSIDKSYRGARSSLKMFNPSPLSHILVHCSHCFSDTPKTHPILAIYLTQHCFQLIRTSQQDLDPFFINFDHFRYRRVLIILMLLVKDLKTSNRRPDYFSELSSHSGDVSELTFLWIFILEHVSDFLNSFMLLIESYQLELHLGRPYSGVISGNQMVFGCFSVNLHLKHFISKVFVLHGDGNTTFLS
jgi:hypothetical protein